MGNQKEKLIALLMQDPELFFDKMGKSDYENLADHLITSGVVVLPCHCGGCEHHHWEQDPCHGKTVHYCSLPHMRGVEVYKDFFCAYAKKKAATN